MSNISFTAATVWKHLQDISLEIVLRRTADKDHVSCLKHYLSIEAFYSECRSKSIASVMGYVYNTQEHPQ